MSYAMLHGLGDCTPSLHCGCLAPRQPAAQALAQALVAHREPRRGGLHCLDHFLGGWPEDQDCPCVDRMARRNHLRVVK